MPFFKVLPDAGAYLDDFHYQQDEVIEYHPSAEEYAKFKKGEAMLWAQETDAAGNPIDDNQRGARTGNNAPGQRLAQTTGTGKKQDDNEAPAKSAERRSQIKEALTLLDSNDDSIWTEGGLPKVEAVENVLGYNVSRDEIEKANPGFKRADKK